MLETTDRQGHPRPQPPEPGVPGNPESSLDAPALAALPAPELPELAGPSRRRRRGLPRGVRLVIRCRPKRRSRPSLLARLTGLGQESEEQEATFTAADGFELNPSSAELTAPFDPLGDPADTLDGDAAEEAWNLDLFADGDEDEAPRELAGRLTWAEPEFEIEPAETTAREPQIEESLGVALEAGPEPPAVDGVEAAPAAGPEPAVDQALLIEEFCPRAEPEGAAIAESESDSPQEALPPESVAPILDAEVLAAAEADEGADSDPLPRAEALLRAEPVPQHALSLDAEAIDTAEPQLPSEPILSATALSEADDEIDGEPSPQSEPLLRARAIPPAGLVAEAPAPSEPALEDGAVAASDSAPSCFEAVHGPRPRARTHESESFAWSSPPRRARLPGSAAWAMPALLPPLLAWLAPPLAGALAAALATAMGAYVRRPSRPFRQASLALAWAGLAMSAAAAAGSLLAPTRLAIPGLPWTWPSALLGPGALAGLAAVAAAGLLMPGRGAARLAALAGPGAGALAVALAGASPTASLLAGAALCAAAVEGSSRLGGWRRAPQRFHLRAWAIAGVGAVAASLVATLFAGEAPHPLAGALGLALLAAACAHRALGLGESAGARALLVGGAALTALAAALTEVGIWTGLDLPAALSLALLAPAAAHGERWRRSQAWEQAVPEAPGLAILARLLTVCLVVLIATSFLLEPAPIAWTTAAAALLLLCACSAAERRLGGQAAFALAAVAFGTAAACALFLAAGLGPTWLPASFLFGFAAPLLSGERLPGRSRRSDWERPILAAATLGLGLSLPLCLIDPAAGFAGVLVAGAAALPLLSSSRLLRRAAPLLLGLVPVGAALALGAWTASVPLLALAAFVSWALARRRAELLPAAALLALGAGLLALPLATSGHWQASSGALAILGLLGATDFLGARGAAASRARAAAGLAVCGLGGAMGVAAAALAGPSLPAVLLAAALLLQAVDLLTRDGRLSRWLRPGASLTWLAGLVAIAPQAVAAPGRGAGLIGAAAAAALLLALMRRERSLAFVAGLCAAVATGLVSLAAGLDPLLAPALFLAPAALWIVAWGIFESVDERDPNPYLAGGLGLLGAAVLLQVHATDAATAWRAAAVGLGSLLVVGGAATRHRVPALLGAALLLFEGALLLADALRLGAERPLVLAGVLGGLALATAGGAWLLCHRAGGRAALQMAWHGDWLRLLAEWRRWS